MPPVIRVPGGAGANSVQKRFLCDLWTLVCHAEQKKHHLSVEIRACYGLYTQGVGASCHLLSGENMHET